MMGGSKIIFCLKPFLGVAIAMGLASPGYADDHDIFGSIFDDLYVEHYGSATLTVDIFPQSAGYQHQDDIMAKGEISPQLIIAGDDAEIVIEPRLVLPRRDRAYVDVKDAFLATRVGETDVLLGATTVFWGKNEAVNLVDVINTKDYTMGLQSSEKQGMPMLRLSQQIGPGDADFYILPLFVENRYGGAEQRMRPSMPFIPGKSQYQSGTSPDDVSYALRYSGYQGDIDYGLSAFSGITRDPGIVVVGNGFVPLYHEIKQYGLDLQWTRGDTIFKAEVIRREKQLNQLGVAENYTASISGFEHTVYGVFDSNGDLALFAEYAQDEREINAASGLQSDVFIGGILSMNDVDDTQYRLISGYDLDYTSSSITAETSRRIAAGVTVEASLYVPHNMHKDEQNASFDRDTRLHTALKYSW